VSRKKVKKIKKIGLFSGYLKTVFWGQKNSFGVFSYHKRPDSVAGSKDAGEKSMLQGWR